MTAIRRILSIGLIAMGLAIVWALVTANREAEMYDRSISIHEAKIDSLRSVMRGLKAEVRKAGEEAKELPEEARLGHATRSAQRIGKQQERVDGLITRARNRVQAFEIEKKTARRRSFVRAGGFGALWMILFVGYIWTRRRQLHSKTPSAGQ